MDFLLTGFKHDKNVRVFEFNGVDTVGKVSCHYSVRTDLGSARKHGIALQDLPLLCRDFLGKRELGTETSLDFTDEELRDIAEERARARTALKARKPPARPVNQQLGGAWRTQPWVEHPEPQ